MGQINIHGLKILKLTSSRFPGVAIPRIHQMFPSSPVRKLSTARIARVHGDEDLGNFDSCNQGDGDDDDDDDDDDLAK